MKFDTDVIVQHHKS